MSGEWNMDYAIKKLEEERLYIVSVLKEGHKEQLKNLQQLDKALGWLSLLQNFQIDKADRYNFISLPFIESRGGFSSYRIMIDNETEDTSYWEEYTKPDGNHCLLNYGDFIIESK